MDETRIELLTAKHNRGSFDCGNVPLNSFLGQDAAGNVQQRICRVYAGIRGSDHRILADSASSDGTFLPDQLPPDDKTGLPRYPLPTAHLGRLAVDLSRGGQRLGKMLLVHLLKTACNLADRIGIFAVDLFSKADDAKQFYLRYGFIPLRDDPFHLYLPMATVRAIFVQAVANPAQAE